MRPRAQPFDPEPPACCRHDPSNLFARFDLELPAATGRAGSRQVAPGGLPLPTGRERQGCRGWQLMAGRVASAVAAGPAAPALQGRPARWRPAGPCPIEPVAP